jgi:multiple antibiotic resistance protein
MNSFFLLVGSYFIGTHILAFFGISLPVVQVGGGLVVISAGWGRTRRTTRDFTFWPSSPPSSGRLFSRSVSSFAMLSPTAWPECSEPPG